MIHKNIFESYNNEGFKNREIYEAYKLFFGTLVSEPRLKIINLLRKGKKNVSEIKKELRMDQSSISHNLARLKKCGFVDSKIDKKFRYYELNKKTIKPVMGIIDEHMSHYCVHILKEMKKRRKNERR